MIRLLGPGGLLALALWVYAIFDVISTDEILVRNLPKGVWVFLVLIFPPIGPIAWLILGRPPYAGLAPGGNSAVARPTRRTPEEEPGRAPTPTASSALTDAHFEAWEEDLARREAALREQPPAPAPVRRTDEPPPRWWRATVAHPVTGVHADGDFVLVRGPEGLTALGMDGERRWTSEPVHDDGDSVVRFDGDTIAYWARTDAVRIDRATGEFLEMLDESEPAVEQAESRIVMNGWVVNNSPSGLYVKSPDGRRWTTAADVDPAGWCTVQAGDWAIWAQADGTVYAVDTTIKTPVTAIQALGLTLR